MNANRVRVEYETSFTGDDIHDHVVNETVNALSKALRMIDTLQVEVAELRKTVDTLQAQHGNLAYMLRKAFIVEEAQS